jgi:hypothetical protein
MLMRWAFNVREKTSNAEVQIAALINASLQNGEHRRKTVLFISRRSESSYPQDFQAFSFILHLLMEVFPFGFYHPLETIDPCFENSYESFLSDVVENVGDRAFEALPVR